MSFVFNAQLDGEYLSSLYENNLRYAADLFAVFVKNIQSDMETALAYFDHQQWEQLKMQVHKIKPNFSMVGLPQLSQLVQQVELLLKQAQYEEARNEFLHIVNLLEVYFPVVQADLNRMRVLLQEA